MKAVLVKQCGTCRAQLIVEDKKEVKEQYVDGRRVLTVVCPVCGKVNEIMRMFKLGKFK